jgi:hypothetical protein
MEMTRINNVNNHPSRFRRQRLTESNSNAKPASAETRCPPALMLNGEYSPSKRSKRKRSLIEGITADITFTTPIAAVSKATP